jgi:hypothetical protein
MVCGSWSKLLKTTSKVFSRIKRHGIGSWTTASIQLKKDGENERLENQYLISALRLNFSLATRGVAAQQHKKSVNKTNQ